MEFYHLAVTILPDYNSIAFSNKDKNILCRINITISIQRIVSQIIESVKNTINVLFFDGTQ